MCKGDNRICRVNEPYLVRIEVDPHNKPEPNNDETYVVECVSYKVERELKWLCTTGSGRLDIKAFGTENILGLRETIRYRNWLSPGKVFKTGPSGDLVDKNSNQPILALEWKSHTPHAHHRKFYFFQKIPIQPEVEVGRGGQQQATSFDWINADKDCAVFSWDPAGRVFDALSLEPIPNASVFLTKNNGRGSFVNASQFELGIINPQTTGLQGAFSYFVSDGDYKLTILNLANLGYINLAENVSQIHPNYNKIYFYKDKGVKKTYIYPAETGETIQQRGEMEYRDIPLIPQDSDGKTYKLELITGFQTVDKLSGDMIFEGSVSHPFTKIKVYGEYGADKKDLIYQGAADNLGRYKIVFPQKKKEIVYTRFLVNFEKANLRLISQSTPFVNKLLTTILNTINNLLSSVVYGGIDDVVSLFLNPIPTYIEGVAYDDRGNILANKEVDVYIKGVAIPYIKVKTDQKGYYKVASNQLPSFPYQLKYQLSNGQFLDITTSKVLTDNQNLISNKKVNFYSLRDEKGRVITPSLMVKENSKQAMDLREKEVSSSKKKAPTKTGLLTKQSTVNQGAILIVAIVFALMVIVGVVVYFYLRQRQNQTPFSN